MSLSLVHAFSCQWKQEAMPRFECFDKYKSLRTNSFDVLLQVQPRTCFLFTKASPAPNYFFSMNT